MSPFELAASDLVDAAAQRRIGLRAANPLTLALVLAVLGVAMIAARAPLMLGVVLVAGVAVSLAVLARPWLGLLAVALTAPFAAVRPLPISAPVDGADLVLGLLLLAVAMQIAARRASLWPSLRAEAGRRATLAWPLCVLIGMMAASLLPAPSYRDGLPELFKWMQVLALYLVTVAVLPRRGVVVLAAALLLAASAQALLGLVQFWTRQGPEAFLLMGRWMRAAGTFRQPNPYAGYLGLLAPLAVSLALWAWTVRTNALVRMATLAAAALISAGLVVSWSRGAWLAFAAALAVTLLAHARKAAPLAAVGLALAGLILVVFNLLPASIASRLGELREFFGLVDTTRVTVTDANFSVLERLAHWQAALRMWNDHLWLGVGIGNYAAVYDAYHLPRWYEALGHAHNVYLNFAAETGLLGLLAYLFFWLAALAHALRAAMSPDRFRAALAAGVLGALVHATVHNLFDNLWVQHIYLTLALLLALLVVLPRSAGVHPIHARKG